MKYLSKDLRGYARLLLQKALIINQAGLHRYIKILLEENLISTQWRCYKAIQDNTTRNVDWYSQKELLGYQGYYCGRPQWVLKQDPMRSSKGTKLKDLQKYSSKALQGYKDTIGKDLNK